MGTLEFAKQIKENSELYSEVISACKKLLNSESAKETKDYLDSRVSAYNQDKYDFGYFPDDEQISLLTDLVAPEKLKKLNLIYSWEKQERSQFRSVYKGFFTHHNLILPYKDEYGNYISLMGRSIFDKDKQSELKIAKYKYSKDFLKAFNLYGLFQAKKSILAKQSAILVEGQIDCITCHANGFHNVVALGGTSFTKYQLYLLLKSCKTIYLLLDNDEPAQKAENKIVRNFSRYINFERIHLPKEYKDVDEYLHKSPNHDVLTYLP